LLLSSFCTHSAVLLASLRSLTNLRKVKFFKEKQETMASQTGAVRSEETAYPLRVQKEHQHLKDRAKNAVGSRAYALYLAEGAPEGMDVAHWLRAESEILTRVAEIRESSSWYIVHFPVNNFVPEQIQVGVDENGVIITADNTLNAGGEVADDAGPGRESLFLIATWPSSVDPSTASAYIKGGDLTLTVKRASGATTRS
jgi:HSP20 family molecular chaperone IbpA